MRLHLDWEQEAWSRLRLVIEAGQAKPYLESLWEQGQRWLCPSSERDSPLSPRRWVMLHKIMTQEIERGHRREDPWRAVAAGRRAMGSLPLTHC